MAADLWQAARQNVAEFELRSAELSFVLNTERAALEAVEREVKKLEQGATRDWAKETSASPQLTGPCLSLLVNAERTALVKRKQEAEARKAAAQQAAAELRVAADSGARDSALLQKHLDLLHASRQNASAQMEVDRRHYQQHLCQLRTQLQAYKAHVGTAAHAAGTHGAAT